MNFAAASGMTCRSNAARFQDAHRRAQLHHFAFLASSSTGAEEAGF